MTVHLAGSDCAAKATPMRSAHQPSPPMPPGSGAGLVQVQGTSLAPVGGYIEPGEAPLAAAQRELREETGYEASKWIDLGSYRVDPNRGAGTGYFWLARNARQVMEANADDLEELQLFHLERSEVEAALAKNEIKVMAWAACVVMALLYLNREPK